MVAITSHYDPMTLPVTPGSPVTTDPNATVLWSGGLQPEFKTDIKEISAGWSWSRGRRKSTARKGWPFAVAARITSSRLKTVATRGRRAANGRGRDLAAINFIFIDFSVEGGATNPQ